MRVGQSRVRATTRSVRQLHCPGNQWVKNTASRWGLTTFKQTDTYARHYGTFNLCDMHLKFSLDIIFIFDLIMNFKTGENKVN